MNSVNPNTVEGLDPEFLKEYELLLRKYRVDELVKTFVVGEVFRHRDSLCIPQYYGDNYASRFAKPAARKVIRIDFAGMPALKRHVLPDDMTKAAIEHALNPVPLTEQQWWLVKYALIIEPEYGKNYLSVELSKDRKFAFFVRLDSGECVFIRVYWWPGGWDFNVVDFDYDEVRNLGFVFLFFPAGG